MQRHLLKKASGARASSSRFGARVSAACILIFAGCAGAESRVDAGATRTAAAAADALLPAETSADVTSQPPSTLTCSGALQDCDANPANGCETDIFLDSQHCGDCNQPCTHACIDGRCSAPIQLSAGYSTTCALLGTGQVRCWGLNYRGELGNGNGGVEGEEEPIRGTQVIAPPDDEQTKPKFTAVPQRVLTAPNTPLTGVVQIASGVYHSCALTISGRVFCWGTNQYGQLGTGTNGDSQHFARPVVAIAGTDAASNGAYLTGAETLALNQYGTCALLRDGRVACWGHNPRGHLGLGEEYDAASAVSRPALVRTASGVVVGSATHVVVGTSSMCVGFERGVACAGLSGMLGRVENEPGVYEVGVVPVLSPTGEEPWATTVAQLERWARGTCLLSNTGRVNCWNTQVSTAPSLTVPVTADEPEPRIAQLAALRAHLCARLSSGHLVCSGPNTNHQLGTTPGSDALNSPGQDRTQLAYVLDPSTGNPLRGIIDVAVGQSHTCGLTESHQILCWGSNRWGELGRLEPAATGTVRLGELPGEVSWPPE